MDVISALQTYAAIEVTDEKLVIEKQLAEYLNHLLVNDFTALLQLLYRVDVPEQKLKQTLEENKEANAGDLLAWLIIERELQKKNTRLTVQPDADIPEEEKW